MDLSVKFCIENCWGKALADWSWLFQSRLSLRCFQSKLLHLWGSLLVRAVTTSLLDFWGFVWLLQLFQFLWKIIFFLSSISDLGPSFSKLLPAIWPAVRLSLPWCVFSVFMWSGSDCRLQKSQSLNKPRSCIWNGVRNIHQGKPVL